MRLLLRMAIVQVVVTGVVLITWGLWGTAAEILPELVAVLRQSMEPGAMGEPVIVVNGSAAGLPRIPARAESAPAIEPAPTPTYPKPLSAPELSAQYKVIGQPPSSLPQVPDTGPPPIETSIPSGAPDRINIPAIGLDAPVHIIPRLEIRVGEDLLGYWSAPNEYAVGWHEGSAFAGETGNTVLSGHHNIHGSVFARLLELGAGDAIVVYAGEQAYPYIVSQVMLFEERDAPLEQRIENARWILPSEDERLTLVTCWPLTSNTHRLIVVAVPSR